MRELQPPQNDLPIVFSKRALVFKEIAGKSKTTSRGSGRVPGEPFRKSDPYFENW
jgi:hypothetical protein